MTSTETRTTISQQLCT